MKRVISNSNKHNQYSSYEHISKIYSITHQKIYKLNTIRIHPFNILRIEILIFITLIISINLISLNCTKLYNNIMNKNRLGNYDLCFEYSEYNYIENQKRNI